MLDLFKTDHSISPEVEDWSLLRYEWVVAYMCKFFTNIVLNPLDEIWSLDSQMFSIHFQFIIDMVKISDCILSYGRGYWCPLGWLLFSVVEFSELNGLIAELLLSFCIKWAITSCRSDLFEKDQPTKWSEANETKHSTWIPRQVKTIKPTKKTNHK